MIVSWALSVGVAPAEAQRGRTQSLDRVLVLPPIPEDPADSLYAVELADEIRGKLQSKTRREYNVVRTDQVCEALTASGFPCTAILDNRAAEQLADFLRADAYVVGQLTGNARRRVLLHMIDNGRAGLAGWLRAEAPRDASPGDFGNMIGDSLRSTVEAAKLARGCTERRDESDFKGAKDRVNRAFQEYPNYPAAAQCLAYVFEATQQPPDSVIKAYEMLVRGDSALPRAWDRLSLLYLQVGDTVKAVEAKESQLAASPQDVQLRRGVAAMWIEVGEYESALSLLEEGLEQSPGELEFLRLKARTCIEGQMWPCALEALAAQYQVDTALVGDTVFFAQVIGAANLVPDTAAAVRWTEEAVKYAPSSVSFWRQRAQALMDAGQTEEALMAYNRVSALAPEDIRAPLAAAQLVIDATPIDSAVPLDTMALQRADSLLASVVSKSNDENVVQNIAAMYLRPGMALAQNRYTGLARAWLQKALQYDVGNRLTAQANFFYGFATFFYLQQLFEEVRSSQSCAMVNRYVEVVNEGKQAMQGGRSLAPESADQLLNGYTQYEGLIPAFRQNFQCP